MRLLTLVPLLTFVPFVVSLRSFVPGQTLNRIIEYALKDVGIHILICSAVYTDASGERKYFRKFFKFQVNNPLSMKSKTHTLAGSNEVPAKNPAHFTSLQDPAAAECHMPRTSLLAFPWPHVIAMAGGHRDPAAERHGAPDLSPLCRLPSHPAGDA